MKSRMKPRLFAIAAALAMPVAIPAGVQYVHHTYAVAHTATAMTLASDPRFDFEEFFEHGPDGRLTFRWGWINGGHSVVCKNGSVVTTDLPSGVTVESGRVSRFCTAQT